MGADNNSQIQRKPLGRPFPKGKSGNPRGRPVGALNKTNRMVQDLIAASAGEIVQKMIDAALNGDISAAKICLERVSAPLRDAPIAFALPAIKTPADILPAQTFILAQVALGELTPSEGNAICSIISNIGMNAKIGDLMRRLETIENQKGR